MIHTALSILALTMLPSGSPRQEEPHTKLSVFLDTAQLQPGQTAHLGVHFEIEKGWHIYWDGLNDTGFPPSLDITLPEGFTAGTPLWPAPKRYVAPGDILDHVYEDSATIIVPILVSASASPGSSITIRVESSWLVCQEACIPEKGATSLTTTVRSPADGPATPANADRFAAARARLPIPFDAAKHRVKVKVVADRLEITSPDASRLAFFPGPECTPLVDPVRTAETKGASLTVPLESAGARVQGIIEVLNKGATKPEWYQIDLPPRKAE
ncbi:MAG: hypothetical protein IPM33_11085 [Phycisphaerales bacterium]|nr:hypothetical protein [Phycisphaerales bacterium]